ncbi:hypothetical protein T459_27587 [Capsicum annuum]|uniref:Uncharacterized protein n=1 Tax=Capsicum annuum TaxID=4072 RepID=A0A2G2YEC6_CAPAN|nr:hypothetical protein T459_27587 [Capsicum annuum]
MVRACAIGESGWFYVHKFVGEHTCGVDHVTGKHRTVTVEVIASLILNFFIDNKGPSPKEIERIIFRELYCRLSFWKYWMAGVIAKNIVQGAPEHGYAMFPAFSYIFNGLNLRSINSFMVDEEFGRKYDLVKLPCAHVMAASPLESEWSVAREYLEMQVLPPEFDPKLGRRKIKCVKGVL